MRSVLIAGNWKMNLTEKETVKFLENFNPEKSNIELLLCPPYIDIPIMRKVLKNSFVKWGAQNVYSEKFGAFTGEISAHMLSELGCSYVICGHSERRNIFNESNELILKKVNSVISERMIPILCVGENLEDKESGNSLNKIKEQIKSVFEKIQQETDIIPVIAYEPVWAIGTGKSATAEYAEETAKNIREYIEKLKGKEYSELVRILYGGSVNISNIVEFLKQKDIDGVLIGGASLDPKKLNEIYSKVVIAQGVK